MSDRPFLTCALAFAAAGTFTAAEARATYQPPGSLILRDTLVTPEEVLEQEEVLITRA